MRDPEEVIGWLRKAESDYQGAIDLYRRRKNPLPDLVCFHFFSNCFRRRSETKCSLRGRYYGETLFFNLFHHFHSFPPLF